MSNETIKQPPSQGNSNPKADLFVCHVFPRCSTAGQPFPFARIGTGLQVGREPVAKASFTLDEGTVSRVHFRLEPCSQGWQVIDQQSANGLYVNGKRVTKEFVRAHDIIRAGNALMVLATVQPVALEWARTYGIVACSGRVSQLLEIVRQTLDSSENVLIVGETGTGKELIANLIHEASSRTGPFLQINCGAIPDQLMEITLFGSAKGAFTGSDEDRNGLLVEAEGGTFLLDEIGELPGRMQVKLLRALEDRSFIPVGATRPVQFSVKVLAATNRTEVLSDELSDFRQDLLARFEDIVLYVPPLRVRKEEIVELVSWSLEPEPEEIVTRMMTAEFIESLLLHSWPRNTRQLIKTVKAALRYVRNNDGPMLALAGLENCNLVIPTGNGLRGIEIEQAIKRRRRTAMPSREDLERQYHLLGQNVSALARFFDCDRKQIYRWLQLYGLR
jgi:transcriptional regulator with PAS, ATPase and Fis domain